MSTTTPARTVQRQKFATEARIVAAWLRTFPDQDRLAEFEGPDAIQMAEAASLECELYEFV